MSFIRPGRGSVGGGGAGGDAAITPNLSASRTSGTAPLAVHFDAVSSSSTRLSDNFRQMLYTFDYGDSGSGSWSYGNSSYPSKNSDVGGPIGAHVFETPGTYTVTLTCNDGTGTNTTSVNITVADPDVTYAGANTICITNGSTGANTWGPSGATYQSSLPSGAGWNGKRVLFKDGVTYANGVYVQSYGNTGVQVGAYPGTGARPTINGVYLCTDNPGANTNYSSDISVIGLEMVNNCESRCEQRTLWLRNKFSTTTAFEMLYFSWLLGTDPGDRVNPREHFVVENDFTGSDTPIYGIYATGLSLSAAVGNYFGKAYYHNFRHVGMWKCLVAHNTGIGNGSNQGIYHIFKFHSGGTAAWANLRSSAAGETWATRYMVVANNRVGASDTTLAYYIAVDPKNNSSPEGLEDCLIENNIFVDRTGGGEFLAMGGRRITYVGNTREGGAGGEPTYLTGVNMDGANTTPLAAWNAPYYNSRS